jgi:hypothetical protein
MEGFVSNGTYTESMTVRLKNGMSTYSIKPAKLIGEVELSFVSGSGNIKLKNDQNSTKFISIYKREERT